MSAAEELTPAEREFLARILHKLVGPESASPNGRIADAIQLFANALWKETLELNAIELRAAHPMASLCVATPRGFVDVRFKVQK